VAARCARISLVPFSELDTAAIARAISRMADRRDDLADAFFERREEIEVAPPDESSGVRVWREQGFAIRLIREGRTWLVSRDRIDPAEFSESLRQIARVVPVMPYSSPSLRVGEFSDLPIPAELHEFPVRVTEAIRRRLAGFPLRLKTRWHRRWVRVIGPHVAPEQECEQFYSYQAETPWARHGALLRELDESAVEAAATSLTRFFRAREGTSAKTGHCSVVLGPEACAVLLHEAVAHALETDTLILGGRIEAALGVEVGSELLHVLDTPAHGPDAVRRKTDDEGMRVVQRWLLRAGVVEQVLADLVTAHHSADLIPGAGRRESRHTAPVPRSTHLELLPGEHSRSELISDLQTGYFFPEASRGALDPLTGSFSLRLPGGRRIEGGVLTDVVGPCGLRGQVTDLLKAVTGVGNDCMIAGAGWCAKGGIRLPVWATTPSLRLETVEVVP
jgi:predicted Zn-dependent protease